MSETFDVIIVGGGGSGLATAVSAVENGLSVLVLEKEAHLGGTTGIAVGSISANGTSIQKKAGITDNPDDQDEDIGKFSPAGLEERNNAELRRFFTEHNGETLEWLQSMGLVFHGPNPEPPNRVNRMHNVVPNARAYIITLQTRFMKLGGTIKLNARVTELQRDGSRISGVVISGEAGKQSFNAKRGVVLAGGDFSSSPEMIAKYKGEEYASIEGINPHANGDGQNLAIEAGAKMVNMDVTYGPEFRFIPQEGKTFIQLIPVSGPIAWLMGKVMPLIPDKMINAYIKRLLVSWQHPEDALFADGAILINQNGERFCNENESPEREIKLGKQPQKISYVLMDKRLTDKYSEWPHFISTAPQIAYAYTKDYLSIRPDIACAGKSLDAVCDTRKIPVDTLRKTIADYNSYVAGENKDAFGRNGDTNPIQEGEMVLLGPAKAYFTMTEGGALVNTSLAVLDEDETPIPGLFAVGQNGLGGQIIWGHGLHIGWAMTSGRVLGKLLAKA
ncbi:MAG: FAD-dependent oxidoreductase [Lentisphaeria bacterium]|nr:FAD-dependent oxidoreductase [Lentisphaeria bacterium]NQZ68658.1 FAD-dependent oxidoreductase [Lentisphaeria bacterium]